MRTGMPCTCGHEGCKPALLHQQQALTCEWACMDVFANLRCVYASARAPARYDVTPVPSLLWLWPTLICPGLHLLRLCPAMALTCLGLNLSCPSCKQRTRTTSWGPGTSALLKGLQHVQWPPVGPGQWSPKHGLPG